MALFSCEFSIDGSTIKELTPSIIIIPTFKMFIFNHQIPQLAKAFVFIIPPFKAPDEKAAIKLFYLSAQFTDNSKPTHSHNF